MDRAADHVIDVARRIAAMAPAKQGQYVTKAGVPWTLVHELREALEALDD